MDLKLREKKCDKHKVQNFTFYCFDDQSFLCSKCFKDHKKHNIEIIDDLREKSLLFKSLNKSGTSLNDYYLKVKKVLEEVKTNLEESLNTINKKLEELKQSAPPGEGKNIFSLSYNEYEKISTITEIIKKTHQMSDELGNLSKELKKHHVYTNFRTINKEVQILDHSKEYPGHPLDIMLGKKNSQEYSLFDGVTNHFLILDLGDYYFLKSVKIAVDNFDCSLKNFKVFIKNDIGVWEEAGTFVCEEYDENSKLQEFNINKEAQIVKLDLIDSWGIQSGNFLLIKQLSFEIGDII